MKPPRWVAALWILFAPLNFVMVVWKGFGLSVGQGFPYATIGGAITGAVLGAMALVTIWSAKQL